MHPVSKKCMSLFYLGTLRMFTRGGGGAKHDNLHWRKWALLALLILIDLPLKIRKTVVNICCTGDVC